MDSDLDSEEFAFWRYSDLVERRIVTNRSDLYRKQQQAGFPRPVKLTKGHGAVALFPRVEVKEWLKRQLAGV